MQQPSRESRLVDAALEQACQALRVHPDDANAYARLGELYLQKACYEQALETWRQVLRLRPSDAHAYVQIGGIFVEWKCWQEAVDAFEHAVALQSNLPEAYYGLGLACGQLGEFDRAIAAFGKARELQRERAATPPTPEHAPRQERGRGFLGSLKNALGGRSRPTAETAV